MNTYKNKENPVTTEIIRNALTSAAKEMNASLFRSAYSPIIYEMKDCSVGIFNKDARMLGQSAGLPIFLGNLEVGINITTEYIGGLDKYQEGDVFIMNDSYMVGTHLNDITIFSPIFYKKQLVGFAATRAHWLDIGSKDPGYPMDSTNIYQEGLRMGPTKIVNAGETIQDVVDLICKNNRFSRNAFGDMNAQIAACRTGEKRFVDIIERFGQETVEGSIEDIFNQTELLELEALSELEEGEFFEEGYIDNDGVSSEPVKVKVKLTVKDNKIDIDLTGSDPSVKGSTNCGLAQTISACRVAYKAIIQPNIPVTGGSFKPMSIKVPEKSIFSAQEPSACSWYFTSLGLLIDLIVKALGSSKPELVSGAHYGDSMVVYFSGIDDRNGVEFLDVEATAGGWGAFDGSDGQDALINLVNGDFKNLPVEVFEENYPLKIVQYSIRQDSGGPGKYRGGNGIIREYEMVNKEGFLYSWFERSKTPAWGVLDGKEGLEPDVEVYKDGELIDKLLKVNQFHLDKGDRVKCLTGGGGGYGNPFDRDLENVKRDIIQGYISAKHAEKEYGVIINKQNELDYVRKEEIRKK